MLNTDMRYWTDAKRVEPKFTYNVHNSVRSLGRRDGWPYTKVSSMANWTTKLSQRRSEGEDTWEDTATNRLLWRHACEPGWLVRTTLKYMASTNQEREYCWRMVNLLLEIWPPLTMPYVVAKALHATVYISGSQLDLPWYKFSVEYFW